MFTLILTPNFMFLFQVLSIIQDKVQGQEIIFTLLTDAENTIAALSMKIIHSQGKYYVRDELLFWIFVYKITDFKLMSVVCNYGIVLSRYSPAPQQGTFTRGHAILLPPPRGPVFLHEQQHSRHCGRVYHHYCVSCDWN